MLRAQESTSSGEIEAQRTQALLTQPPVHLPLQPLVLRLAVHQDHEVVSVACLRDARSPTLAGLRPLARASGRSR
jgi:hypothetical protein